MYGYMHASAWPIPPPPGGVARASPTAPAEPSPATAAAASRRRPLDGLVVQEMRAHGRGLVHEPGVEMRRRGAGVPRGSGDLERGDERGDDLSQSPHRIAVRHEVFRVRLAVTAHVRAVGAPRIGPPVVAFGIEVVRPPRATHRGEGGHRDGRLAQVPLGSGEHTPAIEPDQLISGELRRGRRRPRAERREDQKPESQGWTPNLEMVLEWY